MMSKINFSSLKVKIFLFLYAIFTAIFAAVVFVILFVFGNFSEQSEYKKAETIAELISGNIAAPLQLGLEADVMVEIVRQTEKNPNIAEITIKEVGGSKPLSTGTAGTLTSKVDNYFVIKKDIFDALGIHKVATFEMYYSKKDFLDAKSFALRTVTYLFCVSMFVTLLVLVKLNTFFIPLQTLSDKLSNFNPENPNIKLSLSKQKDEISVIQNTVSMAIEKLITHQQKILQINENLEDVVRERTKELNDQIELFRVLSEASPNAIALFDTNLIYANPAFSSITGYEQMELFRMKVKSFFDVESGSEFEKVIDFKAWDKSFVPFRFNELVLTKKNGDKCFVSASIAYLHIKDRDAAIINLVDLTDMKQKDQMLLVQSRFVAMGEMIGNIAHQWRQPLNIIQSSITKISAYKAMGLITDEFLDDTVNGVKTQVEYLSSTIDDFRSFYKEDSEGSFTLSECVKRAMSLVEASYTNNFIDIEFENLCEDIEIKGSLNRLTQALLNILNNSKDAIIANDPKIRAVHIKCFKRSNGFVIGIKDSGGGIDESVMQKVFDPYFTTKHKSQGTGIGLYMTKQIAQNSFNAKVDVRNTDFEHNEQMTHGAYFTIEFKS